MFFPLKWPWPDMARYGHLRVYIPCSESGFQVAGSNRILFRIQRRLILGEFFPPVTIKPGDPWLNFSHDVYGSTFHTLGMKKSEILHVFCILKQHHVI
jgi:hypothetical protein